MKDLGPISGSPAQESGRGTGNCQGIWLWRPVGIDYRASLVLGETETLGRHKQNLMCTRTQGKEPVTPQEMEPELPVSIWGSPAEMWVVSSLPWAQVYWQQQSWEIQVLAYVLLEVTIAPLYSHQAWVVSSQTTNKALPYWAWPCPPEQDPVLPTASPSHQEAYTSLLSSFTRGQTEEIRTTIPSASRTSITIMESYSKRKKDRIMSQIKEQDKCPGKQLNEVEVGNLPEIEFRIMTVKMIQDFWKRMEAKIEKCKKCLPMT